MAIVSFGYCPCQFLYLFRIWYQYWYHTKKWYLCVVVRTMVPVWPYGHTNWHAYGHTSTRVPWYVLEYHGTYTCTNGTAYQWYYHGTNKLYSSTRVLARIVVEIRAADIAVELEPQL